MCWTKEVSIVVAVLELSSTVVLFLRNKGLDRMIIPLLVSILSVEVLEVLQWQFVEPHSSLEAGNDTCHPVGDVLNKVPKCVSNFSEFPQFVIPLWIMQYNRWSMRVLVMVVAAQPYLVNRFLARSNQDPKLRSLFSFTQTASAALWVAFLASLTAGEVWGFNTATHEFSLTQQVRERMCGVGSST